MRSAVFLAVLVVSSISIRPLIAQDEEASSETRRHRWRRIEYPTIPCPWATKWATPTLQVPSPSERQGLQFRLTFYRPGSSLDDSEEWVDPEPGEITTRLHLIGGEIIDPRQSDHSVPDLDELIIFFGGTLGTKGSLIRTFPWAGNSLEEAWLELRMPGYVYWIEIPYGFVRDPNDPLCPPAQVGRPVFAQGMMELDDDSRIVNWKHVEYDLGAIQNGWSLTLNQSNHFDAKTEVVLYRDDTEVGKSMFLWDIHTPRTSVFIQEQGAAVLGSRCMSIRLHDDGLRRSDTFEYFLSPSFRNQRGWGTIQVGVDDEAYETVVPSSLFRNSHGVADPYHKASIRVERSRQ